MGRRRAKGKFTTKRPKPPASFEDFQAGLVNREDALKLMEAYHERVIKPWVEDRLTPLWKKAWWVLTRRSDADV